MGKKGGSSWIVRAVFSFRRQNGCHVDAIQIRARVTHAKFIRSWFVDENFAIESDVKKWGAVEMLAFKTRFFSFDYEYIDPRGSLPVALN